MPNLSLEPYCESESSLNPYALEFVPSFMKSGEISSKKKQSFAQKMKTATTSTTTLTQRKLPCGDASYLQAQRQLFELMHQLGEKLMPLKAIKVSLAPDGQGINVQFKAEHGSTGKHMLDESLCQDAALHLELSNRCSISRRLPNVLAANFMARMGEVLKDKMEWNEDSQKTTAHKLQETKRKIHTTSVSKDTHHSHQIDLSTTTALVSDKFTTNQLTQEPFDRNGVVTSFSRLCNATTPQQNIYSNNLMPGTSSTEEEPKFE
ncbi:GH13689 [Drosophila grimshawi]|uniref:GH13689 n=2 Tax=Drosophila grimshawi TaxID=7222 RepID=B4JQF5_DROGR|nr:GH13689 [Drosophila grimshawi]